MSEELKPCPFCGGEAVIQRFTSVSLPLRIICSCGAEIRGGKGEQIADAVGRWNRRAERTCRPEICDDGAGAWGVYCSECGYRFAGPYGKREVPEHMATRRDIMPCYCPSCGSRVEVVDE